MIKEFRRRVFYITGREGSLEAGFSKLLDTKCIDHSGRALDAEFFRRAHQEQVELILTTLQIFMKVGDSREFIRAFLLLCGLAKQEIWLRDVWFLSPITGPSFFKGRYFKPAGGRLVQSTIESCDFPV